MASLYGNPQRMTSNPRHPLWEDFWIDRARAEPPRPVQTAEGICDRLRAAAFAEVQAEIGFADAIARFSDSAPEPLLAVWREFLAEEVSHREMLLERLAARGGKTNERPVSDLLLSSLLGCGSPKEFCHYIAGAEERGRRAGERFAETLAAIDPVTAAVFGRIAREEARHIRVAYEFFPL